MSFGNKVNVEKYGIIKNKKGQNIYYDKYSKMAYILQESDLKRFQMLHSRPFMAVALAILLNGFLNVNFYVCIGIGIATYVALEVYFRVVMLNNLTRTKNLDGLNFRDPKVLRMEQPRNTLLVKIIGYWGCSAGIIAIAYLSEYPLEQRIAIYALAAYAIYNGSLCLMALLNKPSGT